MDVKGQNWQRKILRTRLVRLYSWISKLIIKLPQWRQSGFDIQQTNRAVGQNKSPETDHQDYRHLIFGIKQDGTNGSTKQTGRFNTEYISNNIQCKWIDL